MKPLILAAIFFLLGLGTLVALLSYKPKTVLDDLPVYGTAPQFQLTDSQGSSLDSKSLKGKYWVADFFFSTCAGPCPAMGANMQRIHQTYADQSKLHQVSFTVNPGYDTPEILKAYAAKFKADPTRWHFLTGPQKVMHDIALNGFKIGDPEELIRHSQKFILVDPQGRVRGFFDGTVTEEVDALIKLLGSI